VSRRSGQKERKWPLKAAKFGPNKQKLGQCSLRFKLEDLLAPPTGQAKCLPAAQSSSIIGTFYRAAKQHDKLIKGVNINCGPSKVRARTKLMRKKQTLATESTGDAWP